MRIPPGPLTREQRRAIIASIFSHEGVTIEQHEQHLEDNELARWQNFMDSDTAKYDGLGNIK